MKKVKISHKKKLHLARTLMTQREIKRGVSPFSSMAWYNRKIQKAKKG